MDNNLFLFRKIIYFGHLAGLYHLPEVHQVGHRPWQRQLHLYYFRAVHTFMILVVLSNTASTFIYSRKLLSEFLQRLLDSMFVGGLYIDVLLSTFTIHDYLRLLDEVGNSLSPRILAKYARSKKQFANILAVFAGIIVLLLVAYSDYYFVPLSEEEQESIIVLYNRRYGRRFSLNFYVPGVDLSSPKLFIITQIVIFYLALLMLFIYNIAICETPLFYMNIEAHYESLCSAILLLGKTHRDRHMQEIEYTNVSLDEYVVLPQVAHRRVAGLNVSKDRRGLIQTVTRIEHRKRYEQDFVRQLITYHQKILDLTKRHQTMFYWVWINKACYAIIFLVTSGYQVFAPKEVYSKRAFVRYVVEFGMVIITFMFVCSSSERLEKCHCMVQRAVIDSAWYKCARATRKSLVLMLARTGRSAHVQLFRGMIHINYGWVLRCFKFSYTLLNFFTIKGNSSGRMKLDHKF